MWATRKGKVASSPLRDFVHGRARHPGGSSGRSPVSGRAALRLGCGLLVRRRQEDACLCCKPTPDGEQCAAFVNWLPAGETKEASVLVPACHSQEQCGEEATDGPGAASLRGLAVIPAALQLRAGKGAGGGAGFKE